MIQNVLFTNNIVPNEGECSLTQIDHVGEIFVKREDLYKISDVSGGKARSAFYLAKGSIGLVTAGARQSPQIGIVASIAKYLNIPCAVHTINGSITPELQFAIDNNAIMNVHTETWHNNVIICKAKIDAEKRGWTNIPFGMECWDAIKQTMMQVKNIPLEVKRIVMPVGSAMSLCGVLQGIKYFKRDIKVVGVQVGADPFKRIKTYAPYDWSNMVAIVKSPLAYHTPYENNTYEGIILDNIYEAKCIPYLKKGDLLWIVGIRKNLEK